jgi:sugar/nucleoside kinase (ribokinase family)
MDDFLVSISNIFIDDILTWKEEVYLGALGGAGLHALAGCRVWTRQLGIVASAGEDFLPFLRELQAMGIDPEGIQYDQAKSNRQWEIFQPGEIRVGVTRDPGIPKKQAFPKFDQLDKKYGHAAGYHLLWQGKERDLFALLEEIKQRNPNACIVYEPSIIDCQWGVDFFKRLFPYLEAFSPSASEGRQILKTDQPENIIQEFIRMGCKNVALRLGKDGSLAGTGSGRMVYVPAGHARVVDVTGAGNAYAGGLLSGLVQHRSIEESLAMASVSASFEIEQYGLCKFSDAMTPIRDSRFSQVLKKITTI